MIDSNSDGSEVEAPRGRCTWTQRGILGAVCALVIGVYAYTAHSGFVVSSSLNAADNYYNLLVQSFRAGQLNLKTDVTPGLAQLANPYDPSAHSTCPMLDMSYYKGKLYLYFGVTPALMLFWPYVALTGHYLLQKNAAVIFCLVGFLTSAGLLCALWRRYFAEVNVVPVAAGMLALGLATFTPSLLARCDIYEVAISCGYALTMLALAAIWKALHDSSQRGRWLAVASLTYGLGVGARPSLLFGAVILLVPVAQAWRERRKVWAPLLAATGPMVLIGLGLMFYNWLRFDNPFEFGTRYMLAGDWQLTRRFFSLRYFWFNFRVYFLELARWSDRFPFVHDITVPPSPAGYMRVENAFGILTNIPLVWLALAVPLAWRGQSGQERLILRWFVTAVALLFVACALTMALFCAASIRYEVDFLPTLILLAVVGILGLEHALASGSLTAWAYRAVVQWTVRWSWGLLLALSVAFNLLASVGICAEAHNNLADTLMAQDQFQKAITHYEQALRLKPELVQAHNNLGLMLIKQGRIQEAMKHFQQALNLKPDYAEAQNNLGFSLMSAGQPEEAITHYEQALRIKPDFAEAHYNFAVELQRSGKLREAIEQYEQVLRIKPDRTEAHYNLGVALEQSGQLQEAILHYEQALQLKPDLLQAHIDLGRIFMGQDQWQKAIKHYEQALGLEPDFAQVRNNLGVALERSGQQQRAVEQYEEALRLKPDYAETHYNLGVALERSGKLQEAIEHYEQALRIKPDLVEAQTSLARARAAQ